MAWYPISEKAGEVRREAGETAFVARAKDDVATLVERVIVEVHARAVRVYDDEPASAPQSERAL
jgi:hypothetical protein